MLLSKNWALDVQQEFDEYYHRELIGRADEIEEKGFVPKDIYQSLGEKGYLQFMQQDTKHQIRKYSAILKSVAKKSGSLALSYEVHNLVVYCIRQNMNEGIIKDNIIHALVNGEVIGAFALTEPNAGSDVFSLNMSATCVGNNYVLNGKKKFIVNGYNADIIIAAAKKSGDTQDRELHFFVIDRRVNEHAIFAEKLDSLGVKGSGLSLLTFKDVVVPAGNILQGNGTDLLRSILNFDRFGAVVIALGMAESAFEKALRYVRARRQFGQTLANFQGIKFILANMASNLKMIDCLADHSLSEYFKDEQQNVIFEIAKYKSTKLLEEITSKAVDLLGGNGYLQDYEVERLYRDCKSIAIGGGTKEILQNSIGNYVIKFMSPPDYN